MKYAEAVHGHSAKKMSNKPTAHALKGQAGLASYTTYAHYPNSSPLHLVDGHRIEVVADGWAAILHQLTGGGGGGPGDRGTSKE